MTSVGKGGGGAGGPAKGLAPAHFFPLEGTDLLTDSESQIDCKCCCYLAGSNLGIQRSRYYTLCSYSLYNLSRPLFLPAVIVLTTFVRPNCLVT